MTESGEPGGTAGVLAGVRVVELAMWAMGPSAGAVLADWGAAVVKIEHPETGDPMRGLNTFLPNGRNYMFEQVSRGKQSLAIDLRSPDGLEAVQRLITACDVVLTTMRPASLEAMGLDEKSVRKLNPSVVFASGTGYGSVGPEAGRGGFDLSSFWSRSGISATQTPPGQAFANPMPSRAFGDVLTGISAAGAIAAALYSRQRTGEGVKVEFSLFGTAVWAMSGAILDAVRDPSAAEQPPPAEASRATASPVTTSYRTSDDRYVVLVLLPADPHWPSLCEAVGRPDMITDPRYATNAERVRHKEECIAELEAVFARRTAAEWSERLSAMTGVWDIVQRPADLLRDAQVAAEGFVESLDDGEMTLVRSPVTFDERRPPLRRAPQIGEHSDEVLASVGYTDEEILDLRISGALL
ncbi:CoA transferase [Pseudonocardia ailaonensis]|uniref:CoA transferase n=1 Tax=Pseudonocardia ailaonensis TaxID=367279 RepID=A0ABN2N3Y8_9PSEU